MVFDAYSEHEDSYRLEIQGPRDERDLGECFSTFLAGPFSPSTNMKEMKLTSEIEYGSYSPTGYHGMTIQTCVPVLPEKEEAPATTALQDEREGKEEDEEKEEGIEERRSAPAATPREERGSTSSTVDLLDYMPKSGSRPRQPRQKGKWWPLPNHFRNAPCFRDLCSSSKVEKHGHRKNNERWTAKEVKLLVDGVSKLGVGHWSELKDRWFSDSVRTSVHLKDKWRNLLIAYTVRPTSKKKGGEPLDKKVIKKIQMLAVDNPYPK